MAFLQLQNIGKIYVSDTNLAVGIRGVNLSFDRGEFVAVTGKSGSGKSTLLSVISGMDTYEEGELFVEGEPTSHYRQSDWEAYRQKYISFIFQDYNIIESFTVLQNVELALMHIDDRRERRERALELIRRVGLEEHVSHRGSQLSGGQKQRTVIARALAKDSPVILADEPTGNLDSQTSAEIIQLLREISADKLVIIVTHNFEEVEAYATRHVRIFDGAVESDTVIAPAAPVAPLPAEAEKTDTPPVYKRVAKTVKNGLHLGRVRFFAMPKLSVFLCVLMLLTSIIMGVVTATNSSSVFEKQQIYQFNHVNGRAVVVRKDGNPITDAELAALAAAVGAESYVHYDNILDETVTIFLGDNAAVAYFGKLTDGQTVQYGRLPEKANEVAISVPLAYKTYFGGENFAPQHLSSSGWFSSLYTVTGVSYYVDNTVSPQVYFTEQGFETAAELSFFAEQIGNFSLTFEMKKKDELKVRDVSADIVTVDFDLPSGAYAFDDNAFLKQFSAIGWTVASVTLNGSFETHRTYEEKDFFSSYSYVAYEITETVNYTFDTAARVPLGSETANNISSSYSPVFVSPALLHTFLTEYYYSEMYTQASLFFADDAAAHAKVQDLRDRGYIAVVSDETVQEEVGTRLLRLLAVGFEVIGWVLTVLFVTLFLSLCSSRAMAATRGDVAIMRSMGIPTNVIRLSVFVQTLGALLPALVLTGTGFAILYLTPATNDLFPFMHASQYIVIVGLLLLITVFLSRRYIKKMFKNSVKKTIKEGAANE